tara:strand:+ start:5382 stop:6434 length:1053 start_codon:yes stop_codon:yes gene_type:complete
MNKIFKNKKILITGHTGFKGSWLTFWLKTLGAQICGVSKDIPTTPSLFNTLKLKNKIKDYRVDIRNLTTLKKIVKNLKPDFVFHLAAQSLVKKSYLDPTSTFLTNAIGTCNLLESLRYLKNKCNVVIITSDKSYKNLEILRGYKETDELGGHDPYSASKGCAEFIIQSYVNSFFKKRKNIRIGITRAGNVIGGGDWSDDRVVPDCFKSWSSNRKVVIRSPNSTRPWQHVLEVISGYLILAKNLNKKYHLHGEVFNFGPKDSQDKKVKDVILEIKKNLPSFRWMIKKNKSFYESNLLKLNSSKALKNLKWSNKLSFNKTIKMTAQWYETFYNKKDIISFTKKQIKEFEKKL